MAVAGNAEGGVKQYLDLLRHVLDHGAEKPIHRHGTLSVFGYQMRFDLAADFRW